jgi:hypothetical protein
MQFETVKPSYRTLSPFGQPIEYLMAMDPPVVTYTQGCGIYKADARTIPKGKVLQLGRQRKHGIRTKLHHTIVTDQIGKISTKVLAYISQIEGLEVSKPTQMEQYLDRHYLGKR